MCGICGCTENKQHIHHHEHDDHLIPVEKDILAKNNQYAEDNRAYFLKKKITSFNLMSSPGSGKTTLLARTIADLKGKLDISVVVGDQQTDYDAEQIKKSGAAVVQVNTGRVCHLDAHMVGHALEHLAPHQQSLLFIENIGNLVCPALFDLGQAYKVVILSVTEGDNKPLKYPDMFHAADLMLLTKTDLLPYVTFNVEQCMTYAQQVNPAIKILSLSANSGEGLDKWYAWLMDKQPA